MVKCCFRNLASELSGCQIIFTWASVTLSATSFWHRHPSVISTTCTTWHVPRGMSGISSACPGNSANANASATVVIVVTVNFSGGEFFPLFDIYPRIFSQFTKDLLRNQNVYGDSTEKMSNSVINP